MKTLTTNEMRAAITSAYSSPGWAKKVQAMPENRVIAVYYDFLKRGVFDQPRIRPISKPKKKDISIKREPEPEKSEQLTIPGFFK